ncbi:acetate/propionate family kinase [Xiamenia xianingshaonis]|uniref:Acetate kinase n=1 Tax=Xiamenia xianingshaonis TaxID=2682776 RepID=A0A9E6MSC9_9ACTN|nr:acetate kinase [Xiamenia xianingshaonis]NGM16664.1 acetate/propionate family kinase [Eggerthellaceae bacterium zg-893]NHM13667.1 acetate/propionate family kinase [Xiamenia xianingshaonis]NHM15595.1 acetate/propionate family kinase [Xiamenia xianingshaonis]QTU85039.1 acetate kinase [Xiamenia xianingshaonis]
MNVLVINAGSSSLKYRLLNVERQEVLAKGICERVGSQEAFHKHGLDDNERVIDAQMADHDEAMALVLESLTHGPTAAVSSLDEIDAIGHRIVQGGKYFDRSVLIDDDVIAKIDELAELAPLHNGAALMGIRACQKHMPGKPMVAVFDTSFFQTLPPKAYMYPLPYELYEKYAIRKYGAHGTSHRYISERAASFLDEPLEDLKLITCHIGNGCSMSAIDHGVAVDTSMGLTPLDGLMMGTRCGAIDPAIVPFVMEHENLTGAEVNDLMNKKSGLLGISGISNDLRSVREASENGDERAMLAYDMYSNSIKKYIGQYIAVMGGVDAIVLTAGVGENCDKMRRMIFSGLQPLGIKIDLEKNKERGGERLISTDDSEVQIMIIPTDEEYMIARDTFDIVHEKIGVEGGVFVD